MWIIRQYSYGEGDKAREKRSRLRNGAENAKEFPRTRSQEGG